MTLRVQGLSWSYQSKPQIQFHITGLRCVYPQQAFVLNINIGLTCWSFSRRRRLLRNHAFRKYKGREIICHSPERRRNVRRKPRRRGERMLECLRIAKLHLKTHQVQEDCWLANMEMVVLGTETISTSLYKQKESWRRGDGFQSSSYKENYHVCLSKTF